MSNFIEITIGGELRAFRFGLGAIGNLQNDLGLDIAGIGAEAIGNPFRLVPAILYHGHAYETKRRSEEVNFTKDSFADWLEDFEGTYAHPDIDRVLTVFFESLTAYIPGAKEAKEKMEEEVKKAEKKSSVRKIG